MEVIGACESQLEEIQKRERNTLKIFENMDGSIEEVTQDKRGNAPEFTNMNSRYALLTLLGVNGERSQIL